MAEQNRYVVTFEAYVYADNDYMARKKAHEVKEGIGGDHVQILNIYDAPFASMQTRKLDDISKPRKKDEPFPF